MSAATGTAAPSPVWRSPFPPLVRQIQRRDHPDFQALLRVGNRHFYLEDARAGIGGGRDVGDGAEKGRPGHHIHPDRRRPALPKGCHLRIRHAENDLHARDIRQRKRDGPRTDQRADLDVSRQDDPADRRGHGRIAQRNARSRQTARSPRCSPACADRNCASAVRTPDCAEATRAWASEICDVRALSLRLRLGDAGLCGGALGLRLGDPVLRRLDLRRRLLHLRLRLLHLL